MRTINEVKQLKKECEQEIRRLLIELQDKTGLDIVNIKATSTITDNIGGISKYVIDKVELELVI